MKKIWPYSLILVALLVACSTSDPHLLKTQICVYGGSEAGFTAAMQAARMGKQVILIEPTGHPGGMMVEGIAKDIRFGSSVVMSGICRELYARVEQHYGRTATPEKPGWFSQYEPHVAEEQIEALLAAETHLQLIRQQRLREQGGLVKEGTRIQKIVLKDGTEIEATVFIDASIEGDLLHQAGVSTETIREGNARYGESKNGLRHDNDYRQFAVAVDPYIIPGDTASGLIATIQEGDLGEAGAPDKHVQGFCFRLVLTQDSTNRIAITKPAHYDPAAYEIYRRYLAAGGSLFAPQANRPQGKTDLGSWHDLSANLYGENWEYPAGDYATRARVVQHHRDYTQGLIWFLQNDPAVPEATREAWEGWGLCQDEFTDHGGWPRRLYIRSARRMVSDYVITEHHTRRDNPERVADPVAVAWWPPDTHHARRIVKDGQAYNEGFVFGGEDWRPFGISWRALIPPQSECTNLITPTCPSSSYVAYGAIRILPTFMMLGQAAGTAAAMVEEQKIAVQALEYAALRQKLAVDGLILELPANWLELITNYN
jgi:hypothetical protein